MRRQAKGLFIASISLIVISALLVWLPNTNTLLDSWRVVASFVLGIIGAFTLVGAIITSTD